MKSWIPAMGGIVLFGSVSWSCFIVPECLHCADESAGGSGGGTSSDGTTSTTAKSEDCTDNVDNDGDGHVDCADDDCAPDFECIPGPPEGWQGLYQISVMGFDAEPPACKDGTTPEIFTDLAGSVGCTSCSCQPVEATTACSLPQLSCWPGSPNCDGTATDWTPSAGLLCSKPDELLGLAWLLSCAITGTSQPVGDAMCTASGGGFANPDLWKRVSACKVPADGGGCGEGEACVAASAGNARCIRHMGDVSCPSGPFSEKTIVYPEDMDKQQCANCTCSPQCEGGGFTVHDRDNCNDHASPVIIGSCQEVSHLLDAFTWSISVEPPKFGCTAPPGAPEGDLTAVEQTTLCCRP